MFDVFLMNFYIPFRIDEDVYKKDQHGYEYNSYCYKESLHSDTATCRLRSSQLGVIGELCRHNRGRKVLEKGIKL
jgi:hypothetical protein